MMDVIPWSLIYGKLNEQHLAERKATACMLLDYLSGCCQGYFDDLLDEKLDKSSFTFFCWQEIRRYLSADEIEHWCAGKIEATKNKYEYEDINRRAVERIQWRTSKLLQKLTSQV